MPKTNVRVVDVMWKTGEPWAKKEKRKLENIGSLAVNKSNLENSKEEGRKAQDTQELNNNCRCRGSVSSLSRLIKYFRNKYHRSLLGRANTSGIQ